MEESLQGGNAEAGQVVRVGDTVRRPGGPWTPAVLALLAHLRDRGLSWVPEPLGVDERGRSVLRYLPGDNPFPGGLSTFATDSAAHRVGAMVRDLHDAVADFVPPADARWQVLYPHAGTEIIAHQDLAPYNMLVHGDEWYPIDWETAAPGDRLWDLAYALRGFVPLSGDGAWEPGDTERRLRLVADGYRATGPERELLAGLVAGRVRSMAELLREGWRHGRQPWARMYAEGHGPYWASEAGFAAARVETWRRALLE
ncbi:phosphotransferase enzyme family protein [Actinoalloteichus spitiensis]|uniref:phosphotransferase enzyme family protein n=1 Tax=Actinoalloteichus spitiensis TaxID=252394 RepID=UPI000373ADE7|nr:phosphotransferase [Actinoalloteichus spitiensis]